MGEPDPIPRAKRRKISGIDDSALRSSSSEDSDSEHTQHRETSTTATRDVVRLAWLEDSLSKGSLLNYGDYLVYTALRAPAASVPELYKAAESPAPLNPPHRDQQSPAPAPAPSYSPSRQRRPGQAHSRKPPPLLPQSTSEEKAIAELPPVPEYLHTSYACQRSTVVHPPNEAFIEKLKEVRELRSMKGDHVGIRAYSTAIASLSAYPYRLQSPVGRFPQARCR